MIDTKKEQERDELHRAIWAIADELRGAVDGWDFKNYVLGTMFYRYVSENLTNYVNEGEEKAGNTGFDYAKMSDDEAETARKDLVQEKGFFILPSELFCNVKAMADDDENLNETLETVFRHIEESAKGSESESDFEGLFDDFDVNSKLLTFDATTLNTLWVDKNLKMHGLIQAFSRTNRILNSIKTFGNIVCFRNLQKRVDSAISLFGDKDAGGIVLMQSFKDYYYGYTGVDDTPHPGYVDMIEELTTKFPVEEARIEGETNQKAFISLFGAILRMRNLLSSFDEFAGKEILSDRDMQDYLGKYQDLRDEWKRKREEHTAVNIDDDIVFEIELIKQIEINIDYILMLVKKYHDSHCEDKEVLVTIKKAIAASPELRSKKALIENFIAGINDVDDIMTEWNSYVAAQRDQQLIIIIDEEKLQEEATRRFMEYAFRVGEIKTTGTDIDKILPPVSRFGGGNRSEKKERVIERLKAYFEKFHNIGESFKADNSMADDSDSDTGGIETDEE